MWWLYDVFFSLFSFISFFLCVFEYFFFFSCFILKVLNHLWGVDNISNCNAESFEPILFTSSFFFRFLLFVFIFVWKVIRRALTQSVSQFSMCVCVRVRVRVWCAYICMQSYFHYFVCVCLIFKYMNGMSRVHSNEWMCFLLMSFLFSDWTALKINIIFR